MAAGSTGSELAQRDAPAARLTIGGEPVVTLTVPDAGRARSDGHAPSFRGAQVIPGCGMMILQVTADFPQRGETELLASPPLAAARAKLEARTGPYPGNVEFSMGDAILVPYANRIRGELSDDGATIRTRVAGASVSLPANWSGRAPGAERYAMHGLLLGARVHDVTHVARGGADVVRATYDAGDFGGHWRSRTRIDFEYALSADRFAITVHATNVGTEALPLGMGSHPYFRLPSGDRARARLHIPARLRALVNDYDAVLPTGALEPVRGTRYDFSAAEGGALGELYLDDCFTALERTAAGAVVCTITDPTGGVGLRVIGDSGQITAVQVYAPPDEAFVALEPQFNLADPYGAEWPGGTNTGMVLLAPGESAAYRVALELFRP